jgi:hypothetical protein
VLTVTPIDFAEANAFVAELHRHHKPMQGCKFCVAVADECSVVRGVAIVGRPVARHLDDGWTLEVNRCCTDGARNACSMLYGAAWRVARALGFRRMVTYTLPEEGGASLRATGWRAVEGVGGQPWNLSRPNRTANPHSDHKIKTRWEVVANDSAPSRPVVERPNVDTNPLQQKLTWEVA